MKYAIIGSGRIGTALARTFARKKKSRGLTMKREQRRRVDDSDTKSATGPDRGVKMTNH
jgi:predicted dinucleotide-binding enzyme